MADQDRHAAYLILREIQSKGAYSNLAVNRYVQDPAVRSPGFVRELVYGVLRNQIFLDYNIGRLLKDPKIRMKPGLRILLRMGLYQLLWMDGVTDYGTVDETVKLAGRFFKGQRGFVNGLLRTFIRNGKATVLPDPAEETAYLSVRYSCHPDIIDMWKTAYGAEMTLELLEANQTVPTLSLRTNLLRNTRDALMQALADEGHAPEAGTLTETAVHLSGGDILTGQLYRDGFFSVQDESSQLAVKLLDPRPGEVLADICAAPGGKSCAAAERMGNQGCVYARDLYPEKLSQIREEACRLGISVIRPVAADGMVYDPGMDSVADAVWVDAPCSGLGVIRRKPEIKLQSCGEKIKTLSRIQSELLSVSCRYVKNGGRLLYSTCTVSPLENEKVTDMFLASHPVFAKEKQLQLLPSTHGTDGFYICLMRRQND